jgi:xylulose-5-phosphate/fructose-6-phosphate phosphoketolase
VANTYLEGTYIEVYPHTGRDADGLRKLFGAHLHVRGYKEEGTTTTPFDMLMLNDLDRFQVVTDVIDRVPGLGSRCAGLRQAMVEARLRHRAHTREAGDDPSEIRDWTWPC